MAIARCTGTMCRCKFGQLLPVQTYLYGCGYQQHMLDGRQEHARAGLGQPHTADGLLLTTVLHRNVTTAHHHSKAGQSA